MDNSKNRSWIKSLPPGWAPLFAALLDELATLDPEAVIVDAKQKFGRLRVHLDRCNEAARAVIDAAEEASLRTCEVCGAPGEMVRHPSHYVQTLCLHHRGEARPPATPPMVSWREVRRGSSEVDER